MSADNPILRNLTGLPGSAPRSNRGQPDRITNGITQKYAAAPLRDVIAGSVGPSQIIEQGVVAGGPATYSLEGAVTLTLTPAADLLEGRVLSGAITITLTPAAQMLEGRVLTGAVTLNLTPTATLVFSGTAPRIVVVGGRPRHHPIRRKRQRVEAEVQALAVELAAQLTPAPAPWEADDEALLDLLLMDVL